ncbi:MAG: Zn-dependent hydrolase [Bacillota bacterium]
MLEINADRLIRTLSELAQIGATAEGGVTRFALTDADWRAREWLLGQAGRYGFHGRTDAAGNLFVFDPEHANDKTPILVGSHLDTVLNGGRYDGALGVLSALECLIRLKEAAACLKHPVELVVWTEEEGSRFKGGLVGSRAFIGELPLSELDEADEEGVSLREALEQRGLDVAEIPRLKREPGDIRAYLELHIEQGGVLDTAGEQIGIPTGIVGIRRYDLSLLGQANHAGTTPMQLRRDALVGAAEMVQSVERLTRESGFTQAVATVGKLTVSPGGVNIVPGRVDFSLEIRDLEAGVMDRLAELILPALEAIAQRRGLDLHWERTADVKPAPLDETLRQVIGEIAGALGYSFREMPSGAGHDAQHLARICPTGMIFVPSVGGISHAPAELTRDADCIRGATLLLNTLKALAEEPTE